MGNGTIAPNGVGNYQITENGAIQPAPSGGSWWSNVINPATQFQGQYIGLNGNQPLSVPIDPNVNYVFTDNLSGCGVAVSTLRPPSMMHAACDNVNNVTNPPAANDMQWNQNMQQYVGQQGYTPGTSLIVNNQLYGWNNQSANDPNAPLPNAFFYGVQEGSPPVWKFKLVTIDPVTGQIKRIPVGRPNVR